MAEKQVQAKIRKYLESIGCYVVNGIYTKAGVPDLIGCYEGVFFAIEVKTPETRNNVSKLQEYNIDRIRECGGHSIVAWNVEMVEDFIGGLLI